MRVVIAPDSFKECLSAVQVAQALAQGWKRGCPSAETLCIPMADGGEGTVEALVTATQGQFRSLRVTGPLGEPVEARYGLLGDGNTAVIEMAAASGLALVPPSQRNPEITTTRGTGELMRHALDHGAQRLLIGIGGSATHDGGAGMAQALGYRLLDAEGRELSPGGAALAQLVCIDDSKAHPALQHCDIQVACDVDNPLCGPHGAAQVYGPQKGATPSQVVALDAALQHFGKILRTHFHMDFFSIPGAGAAGGLGAGLLAFARGTLRPGVALVADACGLEKYLQRADLVLTGEGCLDEQSCHGKTPVGVAELAKKYRLPVFAIAGKLGENYQSLYAHGIDVALSISPGPISYEDIRTKTPALLGDTAETLARFWQATNRKYHVI